MDVLEKIDKAERATASKIKECAGFDFDLAKALRYVRAFAVVIFDWQFHYYKSLPQFRADWSISIVGETTAIIMGAIPRGTQSLLPADKSRIRKEIQAVLTGHIIATSTQPRKPKQHPDNPVHHAQKPRPGIVKKQRKVLEPNHELLKNITSTLSRIKAAEALGMSPRNFDRLKKIRKITPSGPTDRKRYRVRDLLLLIERKY